MKNVFVVVSLGIALIIGSGTSALAGKRDGTSCRNSKSCSSKICQIPPGQKAGTCCVRQDCAAQSAQCGVVDDGCSTQIDCGSCGPNLDCVSNTCPGTMCGGWPVISGAYPDGSYINSCDSCSVENCFLSCTCYDFSSQGHFTTVDVADCPPATSDISNENGVLTCKPDSSGPCPSGMVISGDHCWTLSDAYQSCTEACTAKSLTCDETAVQAVGSSGTNADCSDIIDVLVPSGAPWTADAYDLTGCGDPERNSIGCVIQPSFPFVKRVLHSIATTCNADNGDAGCLLGGLPQRACPCSVPAP